MQKKKILKPVNRKSLKKNTRQKNAFLIIIQFQNRIKITTTQTERKEDEQIGTLRK